MAACCHPSPARNPATTCDHAGAGNPTRINSSLAVDVESCLLTGPSHGKSGSRLLDVSGHDEKQNLRCRSVQLGRAAAQYSSKIQANWRLGIPTIWDINRSCLAGTVTNLARTNSSCPSGVPNIVTPCTSGVTTPNNRVKIRPANCSCQCLRSCWDSTCVLPS